MPKGRGHYMSLSQYFLMFLIYAMVGWMIEVVNNIINTHRFVNRGFLIGPYCPIYGVGGVMITFFLSQYHDKPITLFVMAMVICAILEYMTSYIMEKLFKTRWWDYSKRKYNINGRICLETMVPFGLLGCFITYITNPMIYKLFSLMTPTVTNALAILLGILFFIDFAVSVRIITNFRKTAVTFLHRDSTEEITRMVKETLDSATKLINNRLVKAFPTVRAKVENLLDNVKKLRKEQDKRENTK